MVTKKELVQEEEEEEEGKEAEKKQPVRKREESVEVTAGTIFNYIFANQVNGLLFPVALLLFLFTEGLNTVFFLFLAGYEDVLSGEHDIFGEDATVYWGWMGAIQATYFLFLLVKYFLMQLVVLKSNEKIHDDMIYGLVRSSCSYFDTTPTGQLASKFSNDIGILDNSMPITLVEIIEGPLMVLVLLANIFVIDIFFMIPGLLILVFIVLYFLYCKNAVLATKELYLRLKSPVYSMIN